jgi:UPF0716 protein FxsA
MSLVKWGFIGLVLLPPAELAAFVLVAVLIGWLPAAALFVATSIAGALLLRRCGRDNLDRLRAAFSRDGLRAIHIETPGAATLLGGILLIFPGFITDLAGVALFVPGLRRWAAGRLAAAARERRRGSGGPPVIDLDPGEWRQIPDQRRPRKPAQDGSARPGRRR